MSMFCPECGEKVFGTPKPIYDPQPTRYEYIYKCDNCGWEPAEEEPESDKYMDLLDALAQFVRFETEHYKAEYQFLNEFLDGFAGPDWSAAKERDAEAAKKAAEQEKRRRNKRELPPKPRNNDFPYGIDPIHYD